MYCRENLVSQLVDQKSTVNLTFGNTMFAINQISTINFPKNAWRHENTIFHATKRPTNRKQRLLQSRILLVIDTKVKLRYKIYPQNLLFGKQIIYYNKKIKTATMVICTLIDKGKNHCYEVMFCINLLFWPINYKNVDILTHGPIRF